MNLEMKHLTPRLNPLHALVLACVALACHGGSNGKSSTAPIGDGRIQVEAASNESPGDAQSLGKLGPGGSLRVRGAVSAFGADQFDSYRFDAAKATTVGFELEPEGAPADFDVWLADAAGTLRERFEANGSGSETGEFDLAAGEVALLVVTATDTDGGYLLTIDGR